VYAMHEAPGGQNAIYVEGPMNYVWGATGSDLKKRIVRVMSQHRGRPLGMGMKVRLATAALVAAGLLLSFGIVRPVHAQAQPAAKANHSIVGTWQGTLHAPNRKLRTVLKIKKSPAGKLTAMFYSIDQTGRGFPTSSISFENGVLNYDIQFIGLKYTGKMSADGNSITGTSTQMGHSLSLVFERATPETAWTMPPPPPHIAPMAANANPGIEVATIKPTKPGTRGKIITIHGTNLVTVGFTLDDLIKFAYRVQDKQIINGPSWMNSDKFDINVKPNVPGMPSRQQLNEMLKVLLTDRFQLKTHTEHKEMSAFVLNVAKGGPKTTKNSNKGGLPGLFFTPPIITLRVRNATMDDFTNLMQAAVLDRPVVNHTGLTGHWDFTLHWTPDATQFIHAGFKIPPPSNSAAAPPPLFTAVREQLGLKLGAEKTSVPVLVIDHVEHPSAD
ncbi:MAG: TIGR03435 family protein, partial [Terriglobia bacterium]